MFAVPLTWEDGDGDSIDLGDWEPAFHAIRGHLEGSDLFVKGLTTRTVIDLVLH